MKKTKKPSTLRRLLSYLGAYKGRMILSVILVFIAAAAYSAAPLFLGCSINEVGKIFKGNFSNEVVGTFLTFMLAMVLSYVVYAILSFFGNKLVITASQNAVYNMRKEIDKKLSRLPLNYYDTTTYGDVLARLTNDMETISISAQECVFEIIKAVFSMLIMVVMMAGISGWLTLCGLISIPILFVLAGKITKKSRVSFDTQMKKTGELNGFVEEYYSGHNVVALFGKEKQVQEAFEETNEELYDASNSGSFLSALMTPVSMGADKVGYTLVCLFGAFISIAGGLSIGMIQSFTQYLTQFSTSISSVVQLAPQMQMTIAAAKRVFEFLDENEEVPETDDPKFPEKLEGKVEFEHVKFGYVPHQTLMHDLNETILPGQKVGVVGPTGAGKTTLVNLIMRFYDVTGGAIKIDGIDIRDMKREKLRDIFGMVFQDTWLYNGSILDNIRYGKLDATEEEVIEAAKAACADSFIQTLPGGYNFILTEGAGNIAQGQRQLLTIARAMLNNPPIMILDEATSSVDTRTEALIQTALVNMMKGKTSFVIAHRLSTIKDSNKILYMEKGDVLEVGTHDELMALNGGYAKLYNSQFADKEEISQK